MIYLKYYTFQVGGTIIPNIVVFSMVVMSRNFLKSFSIIVLKSHSW